MLCGRCDSHWWRQPMQSTTDVTIVTSTLPERQQLVLSTGYRQRCERAFVFKRTEPIQRNLASNLVTLSMGT
jgi:hypothetical protein